MTVGQARTAVEQFLTSEAVDADTVADVRLCVSEAVTNAVVHTSAGGGAGVTVSISAECAEETLVITVADDGSGFRPASGSSGLGLGLPLIATLADSMSVSTPAQGGTEISITFRLGPRRERLDQDAAGRPVAGAAPRPERVNP